MLILSETSNGLVSRTVVINVNTGEKISEIREGQKALCYVVCGHRYTDLHSLHCRTKIVEYSKEINVRRNCERPKCIFYIQPSVISSL